jgi:sterol desaturase/sphingolipid hydroxylase (fatty acid hydroxylase superfamily)
MKEQNDMVYIILVVTGMIIASLERLPGIRFRKAPFLRRFFADDVFYLLTGFVAGTSLTYSFIFSASAALGSAGVPRLSALNLPGWTSLAIAMISLDLGNYAAHWLMHRYDVLWEIHKVHHSSRSLDWLATFRSHILEQILRRLLAPVVLILVGLPTEVVALAGSVFYGWAMFIHSNLSLNLREVESILVTPRLHRRHHDSNTTTMNLGTILTLWDRLLGTYDVRECETDVVFGVPGEVDTYPQGWWLQFLAPLRLAVSRRSAFMTKT